MISVTASSLQPGNDPEHAVDGNPATRWAASSREFPQWLELKFKAPQKAKGVRIEFSNETVIKYQISSRKGDGAWHVVVDQSKNNQSVQVVEHRLDAGFDQLKVTVLDVKKGWATITDLEFL